MSIETRVRSTGQQPGGGGGGGGSGNTAGLAGTGAYFILASNNAALPNSYVAQQGANISFAFSGSNFTINSNTGGASNSAGLMGTGGLFVVTSAQPLIPNSRILTAGSSVTISTDGTAIYVTAITNTFAGSGGLAGTGFYYLVGSSTPGLPLSRIVTAGSSVTIATDSTSFYISATTANASAFVLSSRAINTTYPLAGGGDLSTDRTHSADTAFLVTSNRTISTTSPLGGGGNLGGNLTFTAGSLSSIGSANQFIRVQSGGAAWEYINFVAGSSITISNVSGKTQIDANTGGAASSSAGLAGTGVFYLGTSANSTWPNWLVITPGSSVTSFISGSNYVLNAVTSTFAGSGGLASTGGLYIVTSASPLFPNSRILTAGSSTMVRTDSTAIYIDAITSGASSNSGGLAGTGFFYVFHTSGTGLYPNSRLLTAGSSTVVRTDGTAVYIDAITSGGASSNSGGLAGTGFFYVFHTSGTGLYPNSRLLTAGSSVTITTDSTAVYISALTNAGGGSGTVNFGSANYLAYYPTSGTTVDDVTISVSTGSGIAPFNIPILTIDPTSPSTGDFWIVNSLGIRLKVVVAGTTYSVQIA